MEKLVRCLKLVLVQLKKFKDTTKWVISSYFENNWNNKLLNEDIYRLTTYKTINNDFTLLKHVGLPYQLRKIISRIRCSNHPLAIEKGRHKNPKTPREERVCIFCNDQYVEDEEHFLLKCPVYSILRDYYNMNYENVPEMLNIDEVPIICIWT